MRTLGVLVNVTFNPDHYQVLMSGRVKPCCLSKCGAVLKGDDLSLIRDANNPPRMLCNMAECVMHEHMSTKVLGINLVSLSGLLSTQCQQVCPDALNSCRFLPMTSSLHNHEFGIIPIGTVTRCPVTNTVQADVGIQAMTLEEGEIFVHHMEIFEDADGPLSSKQMEGLRRDIILHPKLVSIGVPDIELPTLFHQAAASKSADVRLVELLVQMGALESERGLPKPQSDGSLMFRPFGYSALHSAAAAGNVDTLRTLVHAGGWDALRHTQSPNDPYPGDTPLHSAAQAGQDDTVHLLISLGADPRMMNPATGESSLDLACTPFSLQALRYSFKQYEASHAKNLTHIDQTLRLVAADDRRRDSVRKRLQKELASRATRVSIDAEATNKTTTAEEGRDDLGCGGFGFARSRRRS